MTTEETESLTTARQYLARAESNYDTDEGLHHLTEGLALLQSVALDGDTHNRKIAVNLLKTYTDKICGAVRHSVDADKQLPEPRLKHLFNVLLAFDTVELELPDYVRALKIEVVRRLIDLLYEGFPEAEKQKMLEQLAGLGN